MTLACRQCNCLQSRLENQSPANGLRNLHICCRLPGPAPPAVLRPRPVSRYWSHPQLSLLQLSSFRLGRDSWQAGRAEARSEPGSALYRQISAGAADILLSKLAAAEVVQSCFREEILRKRQSSLAHVRGRWAGEYDLQLLPTNGASFQKRERSEAGLDAGSPQANGIKLATVDAHGPHLHLGHHGPYQRQESLWP